MLEEELVRGMALDLWRRRRVVKFETGAIQTRFEASEDTETDEGSLQEQVLREELKVVPVLEQIGQLDDSTEIEFRQAEDIVTLVMRQVDRAPYFPDDAKTWTVGDIRPWIGAYALNTGQTASDVVLEGLAFAERLRRTLPKREPKEPHQWQQRRAHLPSPQDLDRIIKVEAHLNKSFDQKLRQLEQLQRASSGDFGPHPERVVIIGPEITKQTPCPQYREQGRRPGQAWSFPSIVPGPGVSWRNPAFWGHTDVCRREATENRYQVALSGEVDEHEETKPIRKCSSTFLPRLPGLLSRPGESARQLRNVSEIHGRRLGTC